MYRRTYGLGQPNINKPLTRKELVIKLTGLVLVIIGIIILL